MTVHSQPPLTRVWTIACAVFLVSAAASRVLTGRLTPVPAYLAGLVGLLAVGGALVLSWRGLGIAGAYAPGARRVLRWAVVLGAVLWLGAMLFPFL